jgi:hypothetical protein
MTGFLWWSTERNLCPRYRLSSSLIPVLSAQRHALQPRRLTFAWGAVGCKRGLAALDSLGGLDELTRRRRLAGRLACGLAESPGSSCCECRGGSSSRSSAYRKQMSWHSPDRSGKSVFGETPALSRSRRIVFLLCNAMTIFDSPVNRNRSSGSRERP